MILKILRYIRGSVSVSIKSFFLERFLNLCAQNDILIWDISYKENNTVTLKMSISGFKKIRKHAYKTFSEIKIEQKQGLPFAISRGKHRKGLYIGISAAVFLFFLMSSFIWKIDISGNDKIQNGEILSLLSECGVKEGAFKFKINPQSVKDRILLKNDALSWIWVEIKGTRAIVSVREKKEAPKMYDKNTPSNIIAKRDALITGIAATNGEAVVREGDFVKKGDLLISGVLQSSVSGYKYINSLGVVKARTWYEKDITTPIEKNEFTKTSKKISKNTVNFFGFDVLLYHSDKIPFKFYDENEKVFAPSFGKNYPLGISFKKKTYFELERKKVKRSLKQAADEESAALKKQLDSEIGNDVSIVKKDAEYKKCENGNVYVKVTYECIEDIAENTVINTN